MLADEEAVAPDFNSFPLNELWSGEDAKLDFEMRRFIPGDWWKAVVAESGSTGGLRDGLVDRRSGQKISNTPPQFAAQVEGSKHPAELGEVRSRRIKRNYVTCKHGSNGIVCKSQQQQALFFRELRWCSFRGSDGE